MNKPIKIAQVGCGAVTRLFYCPAILEMQQVGRLEVLGVIDPDKDAAAIISKKLGTSNFASLEDVLVERPDLVVIASPPSLHCQQALQALESGCHVLCEKPLATHATEAERMRESARRRGKLLIPGHYKRHFPVAAQVRELIQQEPFGPLKTIRLQEGGKFGWPAASDSFFKKELTPGGVLFDIGIHALDLLLWWLGTPEVTAYQDDARGGLEANAKVRLDWAQRDCSAKLFFSRDWKTRNEWVFTFERATVRWTVNDANSLHITIQDSLPYDMRTSLENQDGTDADTHARSFTRHLLNTLDAIEKPDCLVTDLDDAITALRIIETCYSKRNAGAHR